MHRTYSTLTKNFDIQQHGIVLANKEISEESFAKAVREYIHLVSSQAFKLGDLLNEYRDLYGTHQFHLIPTLVREGQNKKNLEKVMCLANAFSIHERTEELEDSDFWELQAVKDGPTRKRLLRDIRNEATAGKKPNQLEIRRRAREAKIATGQGIRPNRGKARVQ